MFFFASLFTKFALGSSGDPPLTSFSLSFYSKEMHWGQGCLLEDPDTGGQSSITVRMEYLFVFGGTGQKVSFQ